SDPRKCGAESPNAFNESLSELPTWLWRLLAHPRPRDLRRFHMAPLSGDPAVARSATPEAPQIGPRTDLAQRNQHGFKADPLRVKPSPEYATDAVRYVRAEHARLMRSLDGVVLLSEPEESTGDASGKYSLEAAAEALEQEQHVVLQAPISP